MILNKVKAVNIRKTYTKYYRIFYLILVVFVMIYLIQIRGSMSLNLYKTTTTFLSQSINKSFIKSKIKPIILGWNDFIEFGNIMVILTGMYNITECPYECEYTTNKDLQMNASVIIFSIRNEHKELPKSRSSKQLYVFCLHESPSYTYEYFKVN
uniref:Fucosyltransferase N-terminal domain-containing protein n=1 Tax=Meloidogyne enterolobii TaxID=390850 RepID=A0A6V7U1E0_MELEN|nr:unnamed protein product [Meloidogyne enterolobii]